MERKVTKSPISCVYDCFKNDKNAFLFFSGGHINPAVTLGVTLAGGLSPIMAIPYIVSQLIGSIIGAGLCRVGSHTSSTNTVLRWSSSHTRKGKNLSFDTQ